MPWSAKSSCPSRLEDKFEAKNTISFAMSNGTPAFLNVEHLIEFSINKGRGDGLNSRNIRVPSTMPGL